MTGWLPGSQQKSIHKRLCVVCCNYNYCNRAFAIHTRSDFINIDEILTKEGLFPLRYDIGHLHCGLLVHDKEEIMKFL